MFLVRGVANRVEFTWSRSSNWLWRAAGRPYLWAHLLGMILPLEEWPYATEAGRPRIQKLPRKSCGQSDFKEPPPAASIWAVCGLMWCLLTAVGFPPAGSGRYSCTQIEDNSRIHGENNTQNITETQNTHNSKQNTQKEKANIKE